jgi:hypothetical protein
VELSLFSVPSRSLASKIQVYSLAGGLFLLIEGQYFFFFFPEWFIYGGIGVAVAALAAVNVVALSTVSVLPTGVSITQ